MKIAMIGTGKWGLTMIERFVSIAHKTMLTLGRLQQLDHANSCIKGVI